MVSNAGGGPSVESIYDPILGIPLSSTVIAGRTASIYVEFNGPADGKESCQFYYLRIAGTSVDASKKITVGFKSAVPATPVSVTPLLGATSVIVNLPTLGTDVGTMVVFGRNTNDPPNTWIALCTFLVQQ